MNQKVRVLKDFTEFAYDSVIRSCEGITEIEAEWRPIEESNNMKWILNHLSRLGNLSLPRIIKGDSSWSPSNWPDDYRDQSYSVDKLMKDFLMGKKVTLDMFDELKDEQLEEDIPLWGGTRKRQFGMFAYISELINHKGQIAMLRGNIKRRREKDPEFLK